jgi:DNA-binding MarR family transcriptional regulator
MDHDENVIAAAMLAVADRVRTAAEDAAGRSGGPAAALTAIYGWAEGQPIEALATGLGLSHSRTVRVVDALTADRLVQREPDSTDARRTLVHLTTAGRQTCQRMLRAREAALRDALSTLNGDQRTALAHIAETLVAAAVSTRQDARRMCRFCDTQACGHHDGRCPATRKIDRLGDRAR